MSAATIILCKQMRCFNSPGSSPVCMLLLTFHMSNIYSPHFFAVRFAVLCEFFAIVMMDNWILFFCVCVWMVNPSLISQYGSEVIVNLTTNDVTCVCVCVCVCSFLPPTIHHLPLRINPST